MLNGNMHNAIPYITFPNELNLYASNTQYTYSFTLSNNTQALHNENVCKLSPYYVVL